MPDVIDQSRYDQLKAAHDAGNRQQYYQLLSDWGYRYGTLAGQVVANEQISGRVGNAYAAEVTRDVNGHDLTEATWLQVSQNLMEEDFRLRNSGDEIPGTRKFRGHNTK